MSFSLNNCLSEMIKSGGSDLLLASGYAPAVRIYGKLTPMNMPEIESQDLEEVLKIALTPQEYSNLQDNFNLDFAYESDVEEVGLCRFRCNAYLQSRGWSIAMRLIPWLPPTIEELCLPENIASFAMNRNGLVLVTGPAGSGKTSTLAAMCRYINDTKPVHMIMIEDPIEYVHVNNMAMIIQRQVGVHVCSFQRALTAALREDPDVIVVGELRDLETMQLAITAAETGHLVLSTMHTTSATHTISRLISSFPPNQQWQVRTMLADSLNAIVSQQLLPRLDGKGVIPAVELMINNEATAHIIRENKIHQLVSIIESNSGKGMRLMDNDLLRLVREDLIDPEDALNRGHDKRELANHLDLLISRKRRG
ncbi:PilT/PilU family type 4a pilus ATPase [bacterium]|nr:PilT/PilU family type 4a pilus ATPase [bacterium]